MAGKEAGRVERVYVRSSDELGRLVYSFNEMAASLEKPEKAKSQMIADVSHELRTPLTVLRTALEGLRDGVIEPKLENFAALHNKTLLTSRLVDDLHQLASAGAGDLSIQKSRCDLCQMLFRIRATVGVQLEDSGIHFCRRGSHGLTQGAGRWAANRASDPKPSLKRHAVHARRRNDPDSSSGS